MSSRARARAAKSAAETNSAADGASIFRVFSHLLENYKRDTTKRIMLIDAFLVFILLTGAIQFLYCILVGTFPFNSFLAGFICCVAQFVLTVALRKQVNAATRDEFTTFVPERAFADYIVCSVVLFFAAVVYMN